MTINRNEVITIPKWILVILIPILATAITSYGVFKGQTAKQDEKLMNQEREITHIEATKVSRDEFLMLQNQLNRIESKLDQHVTKP